MIQYPIAFKAQAQADSHNGTWPIQSSEMQAQCAVPPEFEGPGGAFSPEDLFAQALTNCFVATFKVYAQHSKISFEELKAHSELVVDLGESGKPIMKSCQLNVTISGTDRPDLVRRLAEKAFASGFILNSVKTQLQLNLQVS